MKKIFITRPIPEAGIRLLKDKGFEVLVNEAALDRAATKDEVSDGVKGASAILSILTEKIDSTVMDAALPDLKIIANYATGFDNIDTKAAKERNIYVTNTPDVSSEPVAEHAIALMLTISHRIVEGDKFLRAGKYTAWGPELLLGDNLREKIVGIIGLGRIGSKVGHRLNKGFDMKVHYYDVKRNEEFEQDCGAVFHEKLEELLPTCDFISLHVPLLDSTKHLINADHLKTMKPSAYLINTSRGPVIDEAALAEALRNGIIKGAGLDVFENEPAVNTDLLKLDNVVVTPHIASAERTTRDKMSELAAQNIIAALEGNTPPNLVNAD